MGILKRFSEIMEANINSVLEKHEDPSKMIDHYINTLNEDLGTVKAETAMVMADATMAARKVDNCKAEIESLNAYAKKAVEANNDEDARIFISKKQSLEAQLAELINAQTVAEENANKMKQMHDKLSSDVEVAMSKRASLKAKLSIANTQKKVASIESGLADISGSFAGLNRMENRINRMLDEADAMSKLSISSNSPDDIKKKYDVNDVNASVEAELESLKASTKTA